MTRTPPTSPDTAEALQTLLTPAFIRQMEKLDIASRKLFAGTLQGERRSKQRGQSVEFADYRNYVAGDDLRFIDWNLYARLDKLFLRLFMEEQDLALCLLLDVSASMDWGDPNKLLYAKRLAAALAYIGLVRFNRVHLYAVSNGVVEQMPGLRGRRPIPKMLEFLARQQPAGAGSVPEACRRFALGQGHKGVVVLLSDILEKGDFAGGLRYLAGDRFDGYAVQILAPQELDAEKAELRGDLALRDVEDGFEAEVSISPLLLQRYRDAVNGWCDHVRQECSKRHIAWMLARTDTPVETLVLDSFRRIGLLK